MLLNLPCAFTLSCDKPEPGWRVVMVVVIKFPKSSSHKVKKKKTLSNWKNGRKPWPLKSLVFGSKKLLWSKKRSILWPSSSKKSNSKMFSKLKSAYFAWRNQLVLYLFPREWGFEQPKSLPIPIFLGQTNHVNIMKTSKVKYLRGFVYFG